MFRSYFKSTLRNIQKRKWYSMLTLAGLTIGMTCFILIFLYIRYELSYDRFHSHADDIYRVLVDTRETYREKSQVAVTPGPLTTALMAEYPEVLYATKVKARSNVLKYNNITFTESRLYYADPAFLEIFHFPLISGNNKTALDKANSLLITEAMSKKYFGGNSALGKTVQVGDTDYTVTGILANIPGNTHLHFDFLASFESLVEASGLEQVSRWNNWSYHTYVLLTEGADSLSLENKLPELLKKNYKQDATQILRLQPLTDVHFYTEANFELEPSTDVRNLYLFSAVGVFILLIACFNEMNLSTARSSTRAREIGMRKVIGASRIQLMIQFLGETVMFSFCALLFSALLVKLLLPPFRVFLDRKLEISFVHDVDLLFISAGLVLFVGFLSGSYPSFILSSFHPSAVLKGTGVRSSRGASLLLDSLVVIQFAISVVLIFCTIVVYNQLHFMKNKELGFVKDFVMLVPNPEEGHETLSAELRKNPHIFDVAKSDELPHNIGSAGYGIWDGYDPDQELVVFRNWIDARFLDFYNIPIVQGRGFAEEYNDQEGHAYILNEEAVKTIGWENPIGQRFGFSEKEMGTVVGVVKDFHFAPLHLNIGPMAITPNSGRNTWLSIKVDPLDVSAAIAFVEKTWKAHSPDGDFSYTFLDDRLDRMYRTEAKLGTTFAVFTAIAVFVAGLGLFGLSSFTTEQKTKEIGIRKVLGASEWNITALTTKKFLGLVFIANLIAWPTASIVMQKWLQNFAYKADMGVWIFALSAGMSLSIAFITVGYFSIRAALANPADSLRYE